MAEVSKQRVFEANAQGFGDSGRKAGEKILPIGGTDRRF